MRLGQHFLTDANLLNRLVDALDPHPGELVLEIGAGKGSLTEQLVARGLRVVAIEKDRRLADDLRLRIADCGLERLTLVAGDALHLDWQALVAAAPNPQSAIGNPQFKIVGNIPYAITSPLIEKALTPPFPSCIVFLVQAEVADRLAARPGSKVYGALTVGVQAVCTVEKLFTVKAGAFRPPPKVSSAAVRLVPRPQALVPPSELPNFRAFVTACFTRRRKQLRNVLASVTRGLRPEIESGLRGLGLDPAARPETLAPQEFVALLRWQERL